ncbi:putative exocyst complex component Exo70, cullin repeat-like-containing domain superfamily [Helianthus annuus]|uniref:Exocyst subunit Exo70 family protein n=1 Tax=Helianthus annuus TaxID=4232 RepID=A0A9K3EC69_HELAN|nr:exocyst complex component EXO70H1-like [Helianthus annuus]KAF5770838.1 putative exocyst complex component Exo70, cullin repeat-like-containing domain superfamily [Helianthus annuus]KAJ0465704.1 putative exocyst complex component Exo70, cullin repeat-like-containing domain superfamily [Helianthus annuus]KAJ0470583.1 putative exocyst complex component Exo70, cullin repeat-like-containing domain superfamily [Helianthus annuus]KAJ0487295.1 putative exocyst complex component Exo70, cullin repeat-
MAITTITITSTTMSSPCSSDSMMEDNIQRAEKIIHKWKIDSDSHSTFVSIFHKNNTTEATLFLYSVSTLQRAMHFLSSNDKKSSNLSIAQRSMQIAMKRLEKEFHQLLLDYIHHRQHLISISNLRLIAETMIHCGYAKECISIYKITRKSTIDEALSHLGIQQYKHSHIKKMITAPDLQNHVKIWLNAFQIAIKTVFREEKFLCDHVFSSYPAIRNLCFTNSTKEGALNLFTFPDLIVAICKRLKSDMLFVKMDLHNSISDQWPEIDSLFSHESISSVKLQAESCLHKLGDSVRTFLTELDEQMRGKMKKSIANNLVPEYEELYVKHLVMLSEDERCVKMLMRLSPEKTAKY